LKVLIFCDYQDEDGLPDHAEVVQELVKHNAAVVASASDEDYENGLGQIADNLKTIIKNDDPKWNCSVTDVWVFSDVIQASKMGNEYGSTAARDSTKPLGNFPPGPPYERDDACWEELFHLISNVGYGCAYPDLWGRRADAENPYGYPSGHIPDSNISRALDNMMGDCGAAYNNTQVLPAGASTICHYKYDDPTCFYPCLVNEYQSIVHLAYIGARDYRCNNDWYGLLKEYSFCDQQKCKQHDPQGYALGGHSMLPHILPSGHYKPTKTSALHKSEW
jgi:hypothetical protein